MYFPESSFDTFFKDLFSFNDAINHIISLCLFRNLNYIDLKLLFSFGSFVNFFQIFPCQKKIFKIFDGFFLGLYPFCEEHVWLSVQKDIVDRFQHMFLQFFCIRLEYLVIIQLWNRSFFVIWKAKVSNTFDKWCWDKILIWILILIMRF